MPTRGPGVSDFILHKHTHGCYNSCSVLAAVRLKSGRTIAKLNTSQTGNKNNTGNVNSSWVAIQPRFSRVTFPRFFYQGPRSMITLGIVYTPGDLFSIHSDKENIQTCYSLFTHNWSQFISWMRTFMEFCGRLTSQIFPVYWHLAKVST